MNYKKNEALEAMLAEATRQHLTAKAEEAKALKEVSLGDYTSIAFLDACRRTEHFYRGYYVACRHALETVRDEQRLDRKYNMEEQNEQISDSEIDSIR